MKPLIRFALVGGCALAALAQDAKPNTLTPKQIAAGWISLFDGETLFGWAPRSEAKWQVAHGALVSPVGDGKAVVSTTTEFADFQMEFEFAVEPGAGTGVYLRGPGSGEITSSNAYLLAPPGRLEEIPDLKVGGGWNTLALTCEGNRVAVSINTVDVLEETAAALPARGTIAFLRSAGDAPVRIRSVKLRPLGLRSIFNGKDLAGWKVIPGHKSVYSVTPEGWLNVKDGNGDLQTEASYGDFLFQLEILSNGDHLNSGVFFRALPGQFWSGYESQIRNQWEGDDRGKPVDYGTGGIYNRQPARRVAASDREWFTMTIAAHGPHLATWVNGMQVTDFTDTRPPNESARQGYRAKPGVLSLQGHDPTTNLSFRNLRVAELPAGK